MNIKITELAPSWTAHMCASPAVISYDGGIAAAFCDENLCVKAIQIKNGNKISVKTDIKSDWNTLDHHAITLGRDRNGFFHLSGAMHNVPLKYMRTSVPDDISTLIDINRMAGTEENSVTYPQFFNSPDGTLYFTYRDGSSGDGNQIINKYNESLNEWMRMPQITNGTQSGCSAYISGSRPVSGPDGYMHMLYMWRQSPAAESCFRLCYAKSKDLKEWFNISGKKITLPITPDNTDVIVDDCPVCSGLTNMMHFLGFDNEKRVVLTYHKYSENGRSAIYNARFEDGEWKIIKSYEWTNWKWIFEGIGALPRPFMISPVYTDCSGDLCIDIEEYGRFRKKLILDKNTLMVSDISDSDFAWQSKYSETSSPSLCAEWTKAEGADNIFLRRECGENNNDRPVPPPHTPPAMIKLFEIG